MIKKILVVDDSRLVHYVYRAVLQRHNCEIVEAMNGQEALDLLAVHNDIQLIILDINMPIMNGVQFMEKAESLGIPGKIPIVICSTAGKEVDVLRGLKLGAKTFLKKPFDAAILHQLIDRLVTVPVFYECLFDTPLLEKGHQ